MSSPYTQAQLKTPMGFEHLLEGLCIEVLRSQPENILEFAANHFDRLLKIREETGYDGYTPKAQLVTEEVAEEGSVATEIKPEGETVQAGEPEETEPPIEEQTVKPEAVDDGEEFVIMHEF